MCAAPSLAGTLVRMDDTVVTSRYSCQDQPPREEWVAERRSRLLGTLDLTSGPGIEFGPLAAPLVRKTKGDVVYVDHATRVDLTAKYAGDAAVDARHIVDVDVVWTGQPLHTCLPHRDYAYVVASHVIEHLPDPVGWLMEIAGILRPGGIVILAVPDKRYTFDRFRQLTTVSDLLDAYLRKSRRPSPGQVFDQVAYRADIDPLTADLVPYVADNAGGLGRLGHALGLAREAAGGSLPRHRLLGVTPSPYLRR